MRLYNTLTKKLEVFKALEGKTVRMYNCGPTVYNYAHIGNMRSYVFADILRRIFEYNGYMVKQIINITDVGEPADGPDSDKDKIEESAKKEGKTTKEISEYYTRAFLDDLKKLNVETTDTLFPKATEHITEQIELIKKLESKGLTYKISDGIYFDTSKFKDYGKLGKINFAGLEAGARIGVNPEKKNISDFALWKFSRQENKRQTEWNSPWGVGFPGWHIECSAMAMKYLGETFDVHTGGIDHIPVHHNNEIAQSESVTGKPYVKYWLHNEFVNVITGKMAKSKGNFLKLETLEKKGVHPLAYRYWLLTAHYQSPVTFSFESVFAAQKTLEDVVSQINALKKAPVKKFDSKKYKKEFEEAINNNLNTPQAIALLHKAISEKNATRETAKLITETFDQVLGLNLQKLSEITSKIPQEVIKIQNTRDELRKAKKWVLADKIRKDIENMGYIVRDSDDRSVISIPLSSLIKTV